MSDLSAAFLNAYFRAEEPSFGWPAEFTVITAYNPNGVVLDLATNLEADRVLKCELEMRQCFHFRVTGGSRDGKHEEPGWGIMEFSATAAREICIAFQQLAYFHVRHGEIHLIDARNGEVGTVGLWTERWLGP